MVTVLVHHIGIPGDSVWYRRAAELVCVVACILAVVLFWAVIVWRAGDSASVRVALTRDQLEPLLLVAGPSLLAVGASWWVARKEASQYASETDAG